MKYAIREMRVDEYVNLETFLYGAIFQREGAVPLPHSIIYEPELYVYIDDFGNLKDDYYLCANMSGCLIGAVWVRVIKGFVVWMIPLLNLPFLFLMNFKDKESGQH